MLISLHGCAGWSAPLLLAANPKDRFSSIKAQGVINLLYSGKLITLANSEDPDENSFKGLKYILVWNF